MRSHHRLRRLDLRVGQVDAAHHHLLAVQRLQHRAVEMGLRGLDRHLPAAALRQLGQEGIAARALVDDGRVAEADVHRGRALHTLQRAVQRLQAVLPRLLGPRLHVGLVDLHHVGAGGEQVLDLRVHRVGVVHRRLFVAGVEVVLRLLQHRERAGHGDLDLAVGVRAQELQVLDLDRMTCGGSCRRCAAPGWGGRSGRARCPGCRGRRRRARWRSGWNSSRAGSRRR